MLKKRFFPFGQPKSWKTRQIQFSLVLTLKKKGGGGKNRKREKKKSRTWRELYMWWRFFLLVLSINKIKYFQCNWESKCGKKTDRYNDSLVKMGNYEYVVKKHLRFFLLLNKRKSLIDSKNHLPKGVSHDQKKKKSANYNQWSMEN